MFKFIVTAIFAYVLYRLPQILKRRKEEKIITEKYGCTPPRKACAKWPLCLDLLVRAFKEGTAGGDIMNFFIWVCDNSGNTFETNVLGARCLNTIEPENIKAILDTQFSEFGLAFRYPTFAPLLGWGIFTQDGPSWKHSRELLRPQFSRKRLENFKELIAESETLVSRIKSSVASSPDRRVDLQELFNRFTLDTTTYMLFGKSMNSLQNMQEGDIASKFSEEFRFAQTVVHERTRLADFYWLWDGPKFRKSIRVVHQWLDGEIQEALTNKAAREKAGSDAELDEHVQGSIMEALLNDTRDPVALRGQLINILVAGRDTTACALSWTFFLLVRHPNVMDRLRHEVDGVLGTGANGRQPTRDDLRKLPYLALVLKEVLRLYPSVPINTRECVATTTLPRGGGSDGSKPVLVSKNEFVGFAVYVMHRRKDLYGPDANEFKPERWEVPEGEPWCLKSIGYGYLPFNGGPRVCLGQEFALLEASFAIICILQEFQDIRLPPGAEVKPVGQEPHDLSFVISSPDGCVVEIPQ